MKILVNPGTRDEKAIAATGNQTAESVLQAHGYDPSEEDYTVEKSTKQRVEELEDATGIDGSGKRGVAHRIDDLEDRIAALEDAVF